MKTLALVLALLATPASATTYYLNDPLSGDVGYGTGAVTGTITTDGTIGTIGYNNITGWDITTQVGGYSYEYIREVNSGILAGSSGLSATSTQLLFNMTANNGPYWGFSAGAGTGHTFGWFPGSTTGAECCALVAIFGYDTVRSTPAEGFWISGMTGPLPLGQNVIAETAFAAPAAVSVPGPIVGTGLPGLVLLFGWLIRRRHG